MKKKTEKKAEKRGEKKKDVDDDEDDEDDEDEEQQDEDERTEDEKAEDEEYERDRGNKIDEHEAEIADEDDFTAAAFNDTDGLHLRNVDTLSKRKEYQNDRFQFVNIDHDTYTACYDLGESAPSLFRDYRRRYKATADPRSYKRDIQPPVRPRPYERLYCGANPILRSALLQFQCQNGTGRQNNRELGGAKRFENPFPYYDRVGRSAECMQQGKRAVAQYGLAAIAPGLAPLLGDRRRKGEDGGGGGGGKRKDKKHSKKKHAESKGKKTTTESKGKTKKSSRKKRRS